MDRGPDGDVLDRLLTTDDTLAALEHGRALMSAAIGSPEVALGLVDASGTLLSGVSTGPGGVALLEVLGLDRAATADACGTDVPHWRLDQAISGGQRAVAVAVRVDAADFETFEVAARVALLAVARAALLERERARVDELDRLVGTAKQVAASLDLDTVLDAIVRDATQLLGADSGDMLLWDKERDCLTVVAVANYATEMLGFEVAFGEGVSSQAILAQRPIIVSDYQQYEHRLEQLDRYGFRSIVCAPLIVRDAAIGALNIHAIAQPRQFREEDAELLGAFADLAAIAIDHARRYENETRLGQELARANEQLTRLLTAQQRLSEQVVLDRGLVVIAQELATLLGHPLVVQDHLWRVVGGASPDGGDSWRSLVVPRSTVRGRRQRRRHDPFPASVDELDWSYTPREGDVRTVAPVRVGSEVVGYLILPRDLGAATLDRALVEVACTGLALEFAKLRARVEVEHRVRGDAVMDLLAGAYSSEEAMASRAAYLGYDLAEPRDVLILEIDDFQVLTERHGEHAALSLKRRFFDLVSAEVTARAPGSVVTAQSDSLILLVAGRPGGVGRLSPETLALNLQQLVASSLPQVTISVAIGDTCRRPRDYAPSFRLARDALDLMHRLGRRGIVIGAQQLGAYRLLLQASTPNELRAYARRTLGPLLDQERRGGAELIQTLRAYLEEGQNQRAAARRCAVHVNTVVYRLHRIADLLRVDLGDPGVVFDLTLALRVLDVVGVEPTATT